MPGSTDGTAVGVAVSTTECVAVLVSGVAVAECKVGGEIIFTDSCELSQDTQIHNIIKMTTKKNNVAFKCAQQFFLL